MRKKNNLHRREERERQADEAMRQWNEFFLSRSIFRPLDEEQKKDKKD